jgi:hypothetical protein
LLLFGVMSELGTGQVAHAGSREGISLARGWPVCPDKQYLAKLSPQIFRLCRPVSR